MVEAAPRCPGGGGRGPLRHDVHAACTNQDACSARAGRNTCVGPCRLCAGVVQTTILGGPGHAVQSTVALRTPARRKRRCSEPDDRVPSAHSTRRGTCLCRAASPTCRHPVPASQPPIAPALSAQATSTKRRAGERRISTSCGPCAEAHGQGVPEPHAAPQGARRAPPSARACPPPRGAENHGQGALSHAPGPGLPLVRACETSRPSPPHTTPGTQRGQASLGYVPAGTVWRSAVRGPTSHRSR
jgi:hypothetical protein